MCVTAERDSGSVRDAFERLDFALRVRRFGVGTNLRIIIMGSYAESETIICSVALGLLEVVKLTFEKALEMAQPQRIERSSLLLVPPRH